MGSSVNLSPGSLPALPATDSTDPSEIAKKKRVAAIMAKAGASTRAKFFGSNPSAMPSAITSAASKPGTISTGGAGGGGQGGGAGPSNKTTLGS